MVRVQIGIAPKLLLLIFVPSQLGCFVCFCVYHGVQTSLGIFILYALMYLNILWAANTYKHMQILNVRVYVVSKQF